jgi:hypothetical protein
MFLYIRQRFYFLDLKSFRVYYDNRVSDLIFFKIIEWFTSIYKKWRRNTTQLFNFLLLADSSAKTLSCKARNDSFVTSNSEIERFLCARDEEDDDEEEDDELIATLMK